MKIAIIASHLGMGGVESSLVEIVRVLSKNNLITVFYSKRNKKDKENIVRNYADIKLIDGVDNLRQYFKKQLTDAIRSFRVKKIVKLFFHTFCMKFLCKKKKDIHHCAILRQEQSDFDVVISYHSPFGISVRYPLYNMRAKSRIMWVHSEIDDFSIPRLEYPKFDKIICVSKAIKASIDKNIPSVKERTCVIYNILDEDGILKKSAESVDYHKTSEVLVCSVGRLDVIKRFDLAIRAAKIVCDAGFDIRWIVCGEGDDRERLEALIAENSLQETFLLLGNQINPYKYIRLSDIFCHTSRSEGFGLVLQEAKILHKPVVTTNFPTAYEIIEDGVDGLIVEQSPEAIADAIIRLIKDERMRESMSSWSKTISAERTKEQIVRLLDEIREENRERK